MVMDYIIVGVVVASAVGYLGWSFFPRRRKAPVACAACPKDR